MDTSPDLLPGEMVISQVGLSLKNKSVLTKGMRIVFLKLARVVFMRLSSELGGLLTLHVNHFNFRLTECVCTVPMQGGE